MKNLFTPLRGASLLLLSMLAGTCSMVLDDDPAEGDELSEVEEECRSVCFPEQWKMIDGECYCAVELG